MSYVVQHSEGTAVVDTGTGADLQERLADSHVIDRVFYERNVSFHVSAGESERQVAVG